MRITAANGRTACSAWVPVPGLVNGDVCPCGPAGVAHAVRIALRDAGLPSAPLREERFAF